MDFMYNTRDSDRAPFGRNWCGPDRLPKKAVTVVARYPETEGSGQRAEVLIEAWPARFLFVDCVPAAGPRTRIGLGTGIQEFAAKLASMYAAGEFVIDTIAD